MIKILIYIGKFQMTPIGIVSQAYLTIIGGTIKIEIIIEKCTQQWMHAVLVMLQRLRKLSVNKLADFLWNIDDLV